MQHHTITILILLAATVCYTLSFVIGAYALFTVGAMLELWFWVRLVRGKRVPTPNQG